MWTRPCVHPSVCPPASCLSLSTPSGTGLPRGAKIIRGCPCRRSSYVSFSHEATLLPETSGVSSSVSHTMPAHTHTHAYELCDEQQCVSVSGTTVTHSRDKLTHWFRSEDWIQVQKPASSRICRKIPDLQFCETGKAKEHCQTAGMIQRGSTNSNSPPLALSEPNRDTCHQLILDWYLWWVVGGKLSVEGGR